MSTARESLVVGSKVRAHIRAKEAKMAGEVLDALNNKVYCLLDKAVERAKANKRTTVRAADLYAPSATLSSVAGPVSAGRA